MRVRALVVMLALAVAGCSDPGTPKIEIVEPSPVVDDPAARAALAHSLDFIATTSFETYLNMGPQVDAAGFMDAPHRVAQLATVVKNGDKATTVRIRLIGDSTYYKLDGMTVPDVGDRWVLLERAKTPVGSVMSFDPLRNDPSGGARVLHAVTAAERDGDGFRGTVDMTRIGKGSGIALRPEQLGALKDGGTAVPFEASLDAQGRLVQLRLTLVAGEDFLPVQVRYSAFGTAGAVAKPADADVIVAPASFYPLLGAG
ncbi:hypothetical protein F4553_006221 [Allocatelliglobosispora scoriae]|uniref:LppX_LprAFG lipoprotein n=1 Tax=Allocatelliglobosispora scoriae TaxID=643052 RepID=A0A841BUJ6_9ACTN|nr:hypothetical protein [Allocatelliglobosispora scoriae]MBB5872787.1 hypothetical protein [Allocatelliglobosispora scoriae]